MAAQLTVRVKSGSYPITWLGSISDVFDQIKKQVKHKRAFLITNTVIYKIYKDKIMHTFLKNDVLVIPDGENQKKLTRIENLANQLISLGVDRQSVLIALGGGVIGDITGFLASIYMRGISYMQIPTTLLSMVDSSVGGKTGVNTSLGKNMIGSFYQPASVSICVDFLKTLPERELRCGLAEAVKSALIKNKKLYSFITEKIELIAKKDMATLQYISYQSISVKRWVVQKDEKEKKLRAVLNFGHTLAHSLEKYFDYKHIYHGEAVSIGICFAAFYSYKKDFISKNSWEEIQELLDRLGLPTTLEDAQAKWTGNKGKKENLPDINRLVHIMKSDKKSNEGSISFIFLKRNGGCFLPQKVEVQELYEVLHDFLSAHKP